MAYRSHPERAHDLPYPGHLLPAMPWKIRKSATSWAPQAELSTKLFPVGLELPGTIHQCLAKILSGCLQIVSDYLRCYQTIILRLHWSATIETSYSEAGMQNWLASRSAPAHNALSIDYWSLLIIIVNQITALCWLIPDATVSRVDDLIPAFAQLSTVFLSDIFYFIWNGWMLLGRV